MNSQYIYGQSSTDRNYNVNGTSISEWLYMWYGPTTGPLSQEAPATMPSVPSWILSLNT